MNKEQLRKAYLDKRKKFTAEECGIMSQSIANNFFNCPEIQLSKSGCLHLFLPIRNTNEVDTYLIFNELVKKFSNLTIAVSKSNFEEYTMQFFKYTMDTKLIENAFGISEPEEGEFVNPEQLDLVLVPMIAVDKLGNRIGYGKG